MFDTLKKIRKAMTNHTKYRQTVHELNGLSNRELADLGISRCDIYTIARKHADR